MQAINPGPLGDPIHHQPIAVLEAGLRARRPASPTFGRVVLLVRRLADGTRETPASARLDRERVEP